MQKCFYEVRHSLNATPVEHRDEVLTKPYFDLPQSASGIILKHWGIQAMMRIILCKYFKIYVAINRYTYLRTQMAALKGHTKAKICFMGLPVLAWQSSEVNNATATSRVLYRRNKFWVWLPMLKSMSSPTPFVNNSRYLDISCIKES